MDVNLLGQTLHIPVRYLSSADTSSIDELLRRMGNRLGSMLKAANIPQQEARLHTVFTRTDGSKFSVDMLLGSTEDVESRLSNLTLWNLVPEEAQHQHIRHVTMSIEVSL